MSDLIVFRGGLLDCVHNKCDLVHSLSILAGKILPPYTNTGSGKVDIVYVS